jgi:nitrous oxidase accessory protein
VASRNLLAGFSILVVALTATAALNVSSSGVIGGDEETEKGQGANLASSHGSARADVDRPKPVYLLHERDKRIHGLRPFQELVDKAPAGSVLKPPPGSYSGPVVVKKPLTIDGGGQVTIDAGDRGTVFSLEADGATLRGLRLTGSGGSHDTDDSCLDVRGNRNLIEDMTIDNCLFGIDLKQSNDNVVRSNHISSKPYDLGVRGDALRLWYSYRNRIEKNQVADARDMVAWYSSNNVFSGNIGRRSRYSLHFMFANDNEVIDNRFYDNTVGIYLMYTERTNLRNNIVSHANGAAGMAVGFKESSDSIIEGNEFIYCAVGVGSDLSPFQPNTTIRFRNNRFAYNGIAVHFTSELGGNEFHSNIFEGNLTDVAQSGRGKEAINRWHDNYWDNYQGFDRNGDGIGDTPHRYYAYADQIWIEMPAARFFKTSPVMELLDFLERLAPFSTPELQLKDDRPRFIKPDRTHS